jgi:CHAT domain-containing protein
VWAADGVLLASSLRGKDRPKLPTRPATGSVESAEDRPYAHPFYWVAFVLFGDPS